MYVMNDEQQKFEPTQKDWEDFHEIFRWCVKRALQNSAEQMKGKIIIITEDGKSAIVNCDGIPTDND